MLPTLSRTFHSTFRQMTQQATQPRALVFGIGAIGGIYAAILKRSNACEVSIVARSTYDGIRKQGLKFTSEKFGNTSVHFGDNGTYALGQRSHRGSELTVSV